MEEVTTHFHLSGPGVGRAIQALFEVHQCHLPPGAVSNRWLQPNSHKSRLPFVKFVCALKAWKGKKDSIGSYRTPSSLIMAISLASLANLTLNLLQTIDSSETFQLHKTKGSLIKVKTTHWNFTNLPLPTNKGVRTCGQMGLLDHP